jgi:anti-repressor protein
MDNNMIKVFKNQEFGKIRIVEGTNSAIMFCATDVATALGYSNVNDAVIKHCKKDGVAFCEVIDSMGRKQQAKFVSEGNLYRLIASSHLPSAEKFESWIFDDVIPTIRKTGGYVNNDETFIQTYLPFADDNTKLLFKNTLETIRKQNELIENQKPMVEFANQITQSKDTIDIGQLAKVVHDENIKIGRNKLFDWLRNNKILMTSNVPYQSYIDNKYFKVIETTKHTTYGDKIFTKTLVTGKGQAYIVEKLRKEFCD